VRALRPVSLRFYPGEMVAGGQVIWEVDAAERSAV
jgi:hypothetical protein